MKNLVLTAAVMMVANVMFAGTPSKKVASAKKSSVVYMWRGEGHHGVWYHTNAQCAQCKKDVVGDGKIYVMTEKGAKEQHTMACPVCSHDFNVFAMNDVKPTKK